MQKSTAVGSAPYFLWYVSRSQIGDGRKKLFAPGYIQIRMLDLVVLILNWHYNIKRSLHSTNDPSSLRDI